MGKKTHTYFSASSIEDTNSIRGNVRAMYATASVVMVTVDEKRLSFALSPGNAASPLATAWRGN